MVDDLRLKMRVVRGMGRSERILMLTVRLSVALKFTMKLAMSLPAPAVAGTSLISPSPEV